MSTSLHECIAAADPAADAPGPDADERRRQIEHIVAQTPQSPSPRPRRPLLPAIAALAAVIVTVFALAPRDDDERAVPGAVQTFAAQPTGVVHYVAEAVPPRPRGPNGLEEAWIAPGGDRWRLQVLLPGGELYVELAQTRTASWTYDPRSNRLTRTPRRKSMPTPVTVPLATAVGDLQRSLREKRLRVTGETTIGGKPAYVVLPTGGSTLPRLYVARDGGALLRIVLDRTIRYDIRTWEILPDTPENRALTRMPKHPGERRG
jgi:hypothetical protein